MRSTRLTILAVISLVMLAVLVCGYFVDAHADLARYSPTGVAQWGIESRGGGILVGFTEDKSPTNPNGIVYDPRGWYEFGAPHADAAIWDFQAHKQPRPSGKTFYIGCPNWFLILPCTIAPILWWRRRRSAEARGFAVQTVEPTAN